MEDRTASPSLGFSAVDSVAMARRNKRNHKEIVESDGIGRETDDRRQEKSEKRKKAIWAGCKINSFIPSRFGPNRSPRD